MIFESRDVYEIVWGKNGRAGQVKDLQYNTASALFMLNKYGYTHTHTHSEYVICIAFSTATMVARTLLDVTLYVQCLSCYPLFVIRYVSKAFVPPAPLADTRQLRWSVVLEIHRCDRWRLA